MSRTFPWRGGPVAVVVGKDKCLDIRAVRPGDKADVIFKPTELEDLYATLAGSKLPVRNKHFVLMGKPETAGGRPKSVTAAIPQQKVGSDTAYPYAYTAQQLDAFAPLSFVVRARPGFTGEPEPVFMAFCTPWERGAAEGIQRVTSHKVNEPEAPVITRRTR